MSDELKDFRYYADKAEHQIQLSLGRDENGQSLYLDSEAKTRHVMRAQAYATLATAAPKAEPTSNGQLVEDQRCPAQRFANPLVDPALRQCTRDHGHDGQHETSNGTRFDTKG